MSHVSYARPAEATAAAVLGFTTAALTLLAALLILLGMEGGGGSQPSTSVMLLGIPCAAGQIAGSGVLLGRGSPRLLYWSALAAVAVLEAAALAGLFTLRGGSLVALLAVVFAAFPLPVLTAYFSRRPHVRAWAAAG